MTLVKKNNLHSIKGKTRKERRRIERKIKKQKHGIESKFKYLNQVNIFFGVSYKDGEEGGFSICPDKRENPELVEFLLFLHEQSKDFLQLELMNVDIGLMTMDELNFKVTNNLKKSIVDWYTYETNWVSNEEYCSTLCNIVYGVFFLIEMGIIENDINNGFFFI